MATMNINNNGYVGRNIVINNGKIIIDGKDVTPDSKTITIDIVGDIDSLSVDSCQTIKVQGDVNSLRTTSGDIECRDVKTDIKTTSGDVECGNIGGSVTTVSGDVKSGTIGGSVKTMSGDIKHRK
jgi:hypothetical protein